MERTLYTLENINTGQVFNNRYYSKRPSMSWVGDKSQWVIRVWSCVLRHEIK